jgi:hypothetical protein
MVVGWWSWGGSNGPGNCCGNHEAQGRARRRQEEPGGARKRQKEYEGLEKKIREYAQKAQRGCSACAHVANAGDKPIKGFKIYPLAI